MKKFLILAALALLLGCSNDNNISRSSTTIDGDIVGIWGISYIDRNAGYYYVFNSDRTGKRYDVVKLYSSGDYAYFYYDITWETYDDFLCVYENGSGFCNNYKIKDNVLMWESVLMKIDELPDFEDLGMTQINI